jgi:carboxypeptidase family protein
MFIGLFITSGSRFVQSRCRFAKAVGVSLVLIGMVLASQTDGYCQINTATLSGNVKDASGAIVSGASVVALQTATGVSRTVNTNDAGFFNVPLLQPGQYDVTVSKQGFQTAVEHIQLEVNQLANLNFSLTVGGVQQTVNVTGATPELQTETAGLGSVIGTKEINDLPLNGRQFVQLLQLAPGTVPVSVSQTAVSQIGSAGSNVTPSINGGTGRSNLFFVDGLYATDPFFTSLSISPSVDAIQEFQEQTHTDQAQFGGATGGTVNLATKGGTNQFHGSAYEFFRSDRIAATPYFATQKGGYHQNQFGGTLGGPIIHNKLFFFGFYDGYRQSQAANNFAILPTAAELGGDFSALLPDTVIYDPATYNAATGQSQPFPGNIIPASRLNQGILAVLKAYVPAPTSNTPNANNYVNTASSTNNQDQYSARVDYSIDPKDSLFVRWSVNENTSTGPGQLPLNPFVTGFNGNNSGGSWAHTFSPTMAMQITAGYNSVDHPQEFLEPNAAAVFQQAGFGAGFTPNPGGILVPKTPGIHPSGFFDLNGGWGPIGPQRLYQVSGSVNKQMGSHSLLFGASFYHTWMYTNWSENDISFNQQATWNPCGSTSGGSCAGVGGNSLASMLLGLPNSASRQLGNAGVNLFSDVSGIFAQDSWKLNPRLTVNYGVRWDYTTPIGETNNRFSGFDVHTGQWYVMKNDADTPSGTLPAGVTVLSRNTITTPNYRNFAPRLGFTYQVRPSTIVSTGVGVVYDNWSGALQAAQNARGAWPSGSSQSPANLNIAGITPGATAQNPFGNTAPTIPASPYPSGGGFLDTHWKNAYSWQWNLQLQQQLGNAGVLKLSYVGSSTSRSPIQVPANVSTVLGPTQTLPFPQMQFGFNELESIGHMSYNAFQAQYSKQYANGLAYRTAFTWSKNINVGCASYWEGCNIQDPYNMRSNRSVDDIDVPLVFTFSSVYELPFGAGKSLATSGPQAKLLGGWQVNGIVSARSGQPFTPHINFDNANSNGASNRPNVSGSTTGPKTLQQYFNTRAFSVPAPYTYGNAGRNSLRGPGYTDVDFSLFRNFTFLERYTFQFRAESFNLFNHPNFANPDSTVEDSNFGKITSINSSSSPREWQFAGTFKF